MARDIGRLDFLSIGFLRKVELGGLVADQGEVPIATRSEVDSLLLTAVELEVGHILLVFAFGGDDLHEFHYMYWRDILSYI